MNYNNLTKNDNIFQIKSIENLKKLFIENWNWDRPQIDKLFYELTDELKNKISEHIILAEKQGFLICYFQIDNLVDLETTVNTTNKELKTIERKVCNLKEIKQIIDKCVFVFSTKSFEYIDLVKAERVGSAIRIKRFSKTPENANKLRTAIEQLEHLKLKSSSVNSIEVKNKIEDTFSVEEVSERFYKDYIDVFVKIKKWLLKQEVAKLEQKEKKLRDFIHQVLNRIMFLYFVQKRGCFGENKNFLKNFWDKYKEKFNGNNTFHYCWLNVLFFEALCQPFSLYKDKPYFDNFNEVLRYAPYLNGGLFEKDELDEIGWQIPDELFEDVFNFFESYNFTVEESTSLDIDIAINPEMLGNVYEHMVNTEEKEEQKKAGIFYTQKTEIEFMIKNALVQFLHSKTNVDKEKLYKFVFHPVIPGVSEESHYLEFTDEQLKSLFDELEGIFILDPACGSGHYLVVATQILLHLKNILKRKLTNEELDVFKAKMEIIERNIFGNDIKEWAVQVTKLRLWLDLFVDMSVEKLKQSTKPLLPKLDFKIRVGDSLVQKLGNKLVPLRTIGNIINRKELENYRKLKLAYFENKVDKKVVILQKEKSLFLDSLKEEEHKLTEEIKRMSVTKQHELISTPQQKNINIDEQYVENMKKQLEEIKIIIKEITEINLEEKEPPMIWDLAFAEVFAQKNGFDIIIANPPYVRQENIQDLTGFYKTKKEYKNKLIEQTNLDWMHNYAGQLIVKKTAKKGEMPFPKFEKKSDLYVYFYLKGLKLLNPDGVMCYISSNSWLDVGYGAGMQEILLKNVPIIAIYDNQAKRSFKHADVNTIIAIMKAQKPEETTNNNVRFVMFKKPFEDILSSQIFIELENEDGLKNLPEGKRRENETYKLHIVNQKDLYEYGKDSKTNEYTGNKWGSKYLRAPEIYWKILEKGKGKLVRLGDIAEVRRGFTTGANKFFYVEDITDKIEDQ